MFIVSHSNITEVYLKKAIVLFLTCPQPPLLQNKQFVDLFNFAHTHIMFVYKRTSHIT